MKYELNVKWGSPHQEETGRELFQATLTALMVGFYERHQDNRCSLTIREEKE